MEFGYYVSVVAIVVGLTWLLSCLRRKNIISSGVLKDVDYALEFVKLIPDVINVDQKYKDKTKYVLDVADMIAEYAHEIEQDNGNKEALALDLLHRLQEKYGFEMNDSEYRLARITISESLKWLDKNVKNDENE